MNLTEIQTDAINIEPISVRAIGDKLLSIDLLLSGDSTAVDSYEHWLFGNLNSSTINLDQFMVIRHDTGSSLRYAHVPRSGNFAYPQSMTYGNNHEYKYQLCTIWIRYRGWNSPKIVEVQLLGGDQWYLDHPKSRFSWSLEIYEKPKLLKIIPERMEISGDTWEDN